MMYYIQFAAMLLVPVLVIALVVMIRAGRRWRRDALTWREYATTDDANAFFVFLRDNRVPYGPSFGWERHEVADYAWRYDFRITYDGINVQDNEPLLTWRRYHAMREAKLAIQAVGDSLQLHG